MAVLPVSGGSEEVGGSEGDGIQLAEGEPGSLALQALGKVLDTQFVTNGEGVRRLRVELSDVRQVVSSETSRLEGGLQKLQELQLDHARASYVEATKRQRCVYMCICTCAPVHVHVHVHAHAYA